VETGGVSTLSLSRAKHSVLQGRGGAEATTRQKFKKVAGNAVWKIGIVRAKKIRLKREFTMKSPEGKMTRRSLSISRGDFPKGKKRVRLRVD